MTAEVAKKEEFPKVKPYTDIIHKDDAYYIVMDLPGIEMNNIDITVDKDVLTIEATTNYPSFEGKNILRNEFGNVKYFRQFTLSDAVEREKISANLKNGVLTLKLPKAESMQPKKIQIEAA